MKYIELRPEHKRRCVKTHGDALNILDPGRHYRVGVGHQWTYRLSNGEIAHFCWAEGPPNLWSKDGPRWVYADPLTGPGVGPRSKANRKESLKLLQNAMRQRTCVRCVVVDGHKQANFILDVPTDLRGCVRCADEQAGITIVFEIQGDERSRLTLDD